MSQRVKSTPLVWWIVFTVLGAVLGLAVSVLYDLPSIDSLPDGLNQPSIRITDRSGRVLYEFLPTQGGRNTKVDIGSIPQCMKEATIAVEDKNFYENPGVDAEGILRALWINIKGGEVLAGGSTITQQVARILLLDEQERTERTMRRKMRESILAWRLTRRYTKNEILALYLNQVYYGGMAYGIEAAAQTYFGKPASELLVAECALLAGLPQTPGIYNPFTNPELALERQRVVLGLMQKQGYISEAQRIEAEESPISYTSEPYPMKSPHFIWIIKDQLDELLVQGLLEPGHGLVVRTTLDLDMQRIAEQAIERRMQALKPKPGEISYNVNNAALVALDPRSGEILAMVGSVDFFDPSISGALNMATSPRQTGSAFKPIIYAAALDPASDAPLTAASTLLDVSTTFETRDGAPYKPVNYDGREHGYVSVREALGSSLNIPAVLTLERTGIEGVLELAHRLGIESLQKAQDYDLSLALGGGEMSLLELSSAFSALANQGMYTGVHSIIEIRDADGNLLYLPEPANPVQVLDPRVAWLVTDILGDDRARMTGFGLNSILKIDRAAAVKTGTTTNFHDNWTIGYTQELLVGVWVGNSNYEAMHNVSGLTGAAPIWHETMRAILEGHPDRSFPRPEGLVQVEICDLSGLLPSSACTRTRQEWFIEGTQPKEVDGFHKQIWIDTRTNRLAGESTPSDRRVSKVVLDLPIQAQEWARKQGYSLLGDYTATGLEISLTLITPQDNSTYHIDSNYDLSSQRLSIEAVGGEGFAKLVFFVDGNILAEVSSSPYQAWWKLSEGRHHIWIEGFTLEGLWIKSNEAVIEVIK
ncbi:MAG: penicillin-binding protein 1C [Chloroflexi bacterium]|nr:penicillin-binding protein 1C [Chloroflexota bacterium]